MYLKQLLRTCLLLIITSLYACTVKEEKVTAAEATAVCQKLEKDAKVRSPDFLSDVLNREVFAERVSASSNGQVNSLIKKGIQEGLKNNVLGQQIVNALGKDGSYELVKQYEKDGKQRAIFRLLSGDGLNYHDYEFTKVNNKVGVSDVFIYMTGEMLSKTMADIFISMDGKLSQLENMDTKLSKIKKLTEKGNYEEALDEYHKLPLEIKNAKNFRMTYLQIMSGISDSAYKKALSEFEVQYRNEPNMYLSLLDVYFVNKEYDQALVAINKVDSLINKDTYLDYYRGLMRKTQERYPEAITYFEQASQHHPDKSEIWIQLIDLYMNNQQEAKAKATYAKLKTSPSYKSRDYQILELSYPELR